MNLISQEDFILKIKLKHKNENYNYDKIIYKGNRYNIIISCKKHGDFEVVASSFLNGQKCTKCELDDRKNECINKAKKSTTINIYIIMQTIKHQKYLLK